MHARSPLRQLLLVLCLGLATPAWANWMGGIQLESGPTEHFGHLQQARVNFDFNVNNPNGARFMTRGYHDGVQVPGLYWGGSPNYPAGTAGTHSNYITFAAGDVVVDQYQIAMLDPVTSEVLLQTYLPVSYFFGPHAVSNIQVDHTSPSWLLNGQQLVVDFDYQTSEPGGVRIVARPYTGGGLTPGYSASGVGLSPAGSGTSSQSFTFPVVEANVEAVRFQMWNADYSTLLLEVFYPVELHWGAHSISNVTLDPPFPACLGTDQEVTVEFDYATTNPAGCLAWAYGVDESQSTILYQIYTASLILPDSGHLVRQFRFPGLAGTGEAAFVRLHMRDRANTTDYLKFDIPVSYPFGPHAVNNVVFYPASPAVLDLGERVDVSFDYVTSEPAGVRIQSMPFSYESQTPGYGVSGSPFYATGAGSGTSYLTILSGERLVNSVHMTLSQDGTWDPRVACVVPADFTFGGVGGVTAAPEVPVAGAVVLGQNYPNPFNPLTQIPVDLAKAGRVVLDVYDLRGRLVRKVTDAILPAGRNLIAFDGTRLASGAYFYAVQTDLGRQTRRMLLLK